MSDESFLERLLAAVLSNVHSEQADNTDTLRFPDEGRPSRMARLAKERVLAATRRAGFAYAQGFKPARAAEKLALVLRHADALERLWASLTDERSREILVSVLAYRVLGARRVRLPIDRSAQKRSIRAIQGQLVRQRHTASVAGGLGWLDEYDLSPLGLPIRLEAHCLNILNTFVSQQYRWGQGDWCVQAGPGDVVIDAGACWGDTTLYFAHQVGGAGRVVAYEFEPANLEIMRRNLERNPELAARVLLEPHALWSEAGQSLAAPSAGPGTRVSVSGGADGGITTDTIDALVARQRVPRVDFIKMDIEGAELEALRGARETLKRFRPRLAISLYHRPDDIWQIPEFVQGLGVGYRVSLDHFTIHGEETMLFCDAARQSAAAPATARRELASEAES